MKMKGSIARGFARVGPAIEKLAGRAKTTIALLAARRVSQRDHAVAPRRTTSPPPGGGLHASGKRITRGEIDVTVEEPAAASKLRITCCTRLRGRCGG